MLYTTFPSDLEDNLNVVLKILPDKTYSDIPVTSTDTVVSYILNSSIIEFPDRVYLLDVTDTVYDTLSQVQKQILCCIYTRSCDGYIREKYIRKLLDMSFEQWTFPFIIKLSDEYVLEILKIIYSKLKERNNADIQSFCFENKESIKKSYSRMISYWNEYHREQEPDFRKYVGRMLFIECFGYNKTLYK